MPLVLPQVTLSIKLNDYHFRIVNKDKNTYSVLILDSSNHVLADFPLDTMDNTLVGVIDKALINKLGEDANVVLAFLSKFLQEHVGAKEFVILPRDANLPNYQKAEEQEFKRLRHASREDLLKASFNVLEQFQKLNAELDSQLKGVLGIANLEKQLQHDKPYEEIFSFLQFGNFTQSKMAEYKQGDIDGTKVRFHHASVETFSLLTFQNELSGIARILLMGNGCAYLSDEIINQELIPLEKFPGNSLNEKMQNRVRFFLAYLINKICLTTNQSHFLIIAASGREAIYDEVGFKSLPLESCDYVVTMKLTQPAATLIAIKESLTKPAVSQAAAVGTFGLMSVSQVPEMITAQQISAMPANK